jgi:hypothetical protein
MKISLVSFSYLPYRSAPNDSDANWGVMFNDTSGCYFYYYNNDFENLSTNVLLFMCALVRMYLKGASVKKRPQKPPVVRLH